MGELFTLQFYKDIPWVLATGGAKGEMAVWDLEECEQIKTHFQDQLESLDQKEDEEEENESVDDEEEEEKEVKKKKSKKIQNKKKSKSSS